MTLTIHNSKTIDFIAVVFLLLASAIAILEFRLGLMTSILLYLGAPSAYLIFKEKKPLKEITLASAVFGVFLGMVWDFAAEHNLAYTTHYDIPALASFAVDKTPYGDFIWAFLVPFSIIVFYEHFIDDDKAWKPSKKHWRVFTASALFFIAGFSWFLLFPDRPVHQYSYLTLGLISVLPLVGLMFVRRRLVQKIMLCGLYFALLNLVFEITARTLGQWSFPGTYIGSVVLGNVTFPAEELFLWILPSAMVFVFLYEIVFDDRR